MNLHNSMEDVVYRYLDSVLSKYNNVCKCTKCKLDIVALALNNLPPQYTVTEKGKLFTKVKEMEAQYEVDIVREITKAIEIVSRKPHHENG
ncbi:late competence development ComFB family protein [Proteiniborus sp.]|uniref:late competence development ComFB family protein n=1 Tax=Proteiniborus sp. TaxID=2079015 RepID=UPI003325892E